MFHISTSNSRKARDAETEVESAMRHDGDEATDPVSDMAWSPRGERVATACGNFLYIIHATTGQLEHKAPFSPKLEEQ